MAVSVKSSLPLSAGQLGIWFAQKTDPLGPGYNILEYTEICGYLDPVLFEQALRQVVAETEALRVHIIEDAAGLRQVVDASLTWSMPIIDISVETDARATVESWMTRNLAQPVDPTRGPLFAFVLLKAATDRFFWCVRYHHIVIDGATRGARLHGPRQ
jgi:NRPS condensation-like uncharacterized protein